MNCIHEVSSHSHAYVMITTKVLADVLLVTVEVDAIDASNAADMKAQLKAVEAADSSRVVLDIAAVEFIDSSGIGALLSFYKQMEQKVSLKNPTPTVLSVLELLRLHRVFEIESE